MARRRGQEWNELRSTDLMTTTPTAGAVSVDTTTLTLRDEQTYAGAHRKSAIVLHFTAGSTARGARDTWARDEAHIATAFIVDKNGAIYRTFDPAKRWAYALGVKGGTPLEKRAVQIEIVNEGPLVRRGDVLHWWPRDYWTPFCKTVETERYVESQYRGKQFYAAFPDEQQEAVARLVGSLCDQFDIPREIDFSRIRAFDLPFFVKFEGIFGHENVRADKYDMGPAWDWEALARRLKTGTACVEGP
jgi:N-acetyl-anhydromuramyl-L-alanine amidase AmpD